MEKRRTTGRELRDLTVLLVVATLVGVTALWGISYGGPQAVTGICVLVFLAAFASGSGLGFIFGLPRVYSDDAQYQKAAEAVAAGGERSKRRLKSNANLERVSDWLTTMIVGVALTQVLKIGEGLAQFQVFLRGFASACPAQAPCDKAALVAAGPIVLIMGAVAGFLFMYLYTRLVLTAVFDEVEDNLGSPLSPDASQRLQAESVTAGGAARAAHPADRTGQDTRLSVEAALQLMFRALYDKPPEGYTKVINMAAMLASTPATARADYWFYQAAAFGQKLSDLRRRRRRPKDIDELNADEQSALDNAIDCARRAVNIDPAYKARLRNLTQGSSSGDDDLILVAHDPRFQALVTP